ncbi:MAG: DUF1559 domain-containing protein [Planctomycetota bacterium]
MPVVSRHASRESLFSNRRRSGFTLVELLVVITIIGILMGLLIPAVNAARETARRSQCATQIKNMSLAAIQYEQTKNEFPGYLQRMEDFETSPNPTAINPADPADGNSTGSPGVSTHAKHATWAIMLLPFLDAQATYEIWNESRYAIRGYGNGEYPDTELGINSVAAPNLPIMQCPSSPVTVGEYGKNNYIANTGMHVPINPEDTSVAAQTAPSPSSNANDRVSFMDSMSRGNGVFNYKVVDGYFGTNPQNVSDQGPSVRMTDLKDGASTTALFSENLQAQPWYRPIIPGFHGWVLTGNPGEWHVDGFEQARYIHGWVWHYEDDKNFGGAPSVDPRHRINGGNPLVNEMDDNASDPAYYIHVARPSSAHVDGVNVGFADGRVQFVQESIDYRTYQALLTPRGKSSDVPWPEFVLQEESL